MCQSVECGVPWISCPKVGLIDQHRHTRVNFRRELGVGTRAEDGRGLCVRIDAGDVLSGERETAFRFGKLVRIGEEESEIRRLYVAPDGQQGITKD